MSEIFALQLTAVATLGLGVFALATAILALAAWRSQASEVRDQGELLKLQAGEFRQAAAEREREALERRRAQAVQAYIWATREYHDDHETNTTVCHIRNTSHQPIYYVCLFLTEPASPMYGRQAAEGWNDPLMPGEEYTHTSISANAGRGGSFWPRDGIVAYFYDSAGVHWCIKPGRHPVETDLKNWPIETD